MFVIRLANGNLLVPEYAIGGGMIGDAYVEIGPEDADFTRLGVTAVSMPEDEERRQRWRDEDESLRHEFLDYLARHGSAGWGADQ